MTTLDQRAETYSDIWRWSIQTSPPTSNGQVRTDSGDWTASASALWIMKLSDNNTDASASLVALDVGNAVYLQHNTDPSRWAQFDVTGPAVDAGAYFDIPVTYQDGEGNLPNGGTQIQAQLLMSPVAGPGGIANWSMHYIDGSHWMSVVVCEHGTSSSGVWLSMPIADDRNFEEQAEPAFANHQSLYSDCDCTLVLDWTPSYTPPVSDQAAATASTEEAPPEPRAGGSATFQIWANYPKLYGGRVSCSHGWAQSGCWRGTVGWPDLQQVQDETYRNHQRLFGCGDLLAPADNTAALMLNGVTVARGLLQPVPEATGVVTGAALQWNGSRLSVLQSGIFTMTASISLARSIAQGAAGFAHLLIQGVSIARAPILQAGSTPVAVVTWSGQLPAGYTVRVGYENSTPMAYQDVLAGGTLNAASITVLAPTL